MHLIQDKAVPAHVRNDAHPWKENRFGNTFEKWVEDKFKTLEDLKSFVPSPKFPEMPLDTTVDHDGQTLEAYASLTDTDQYNGTNPTASLSIGLAEYTNANFFSDDTIFAAERYQSEPNHRHFFPYPKKSSTNLQQYIAQIPLPEKRTAYDGVQDLVLPPISKVTDGEFVSYFLQPTYFTNEPEVGEVEATYYRSFFRDDECHRDYAALLIPRAVGYSAKLIDYFFRGTIEITSPVIGISAPEGSTFTNVGINKVSVLAKNTSAYEEQMPAGSLTLVAKYKIDPADAFENPPPELSNEFQYVVADLPGTHSISRSTPEKFDFDLSANPIPVNANEVYLYLVYRGQLGSESDAVAVGFKQLEIRTLEVSRLDDGVYSFTDADPAVINPTVYGFENIKLYAKNISADGQDMSGGTVQLVLKYMVADQDQFQDDAPNPIFVFHTIAKELQNISLPHDTPVQLEFDISGTPLPLWATDVTLYLFYIGPIGAESEAAAVGFKDIFGPTPVDVFNLLDKICIEDTLYDAGSPEAIAAVDVDGNGIADPDEWDVYPHDLYDIYTRFSPIDNPQNASASVGGYHHYVESVGLGGHFRLFVLSDERFNLSTNLMVRPLPAYPDDKFPHTQRTLKLTGGKGVENQIYLMEEPIEVGPNMQTWWNRKIGDFTTYRGVEAYTGYTFINPPLPHDSQCIYHD
jgi:hypothetical protein